MGKRSQNSQKPVQTNKGEPFAGKIILAIIAALAMIIVALIGYSATIRGTSLPIEATQTAESLHTAIAMTRQAVDASQTSIAMATQTAEALRVSLIMTEQAFAGQVTDTPIPSQTPLPTPTEVKAIRYDYTVESGDTLKEISKKYFTVDFYAEAIGRANCNQSPSAGDILVIRYYSIQPGDRLDRIAERFNSKVSFVRYINNLKEEVIFLPPSQILILPGKCGG